MTKEANAHLPLYVSTHDLLKIVEEQGQVTELRGELTMENGSYIRLYVMDGGSVDVVACGIDIPHDVLGEYVDVDPSYFGP